jgi:hypothetical protein
MNCHSSTVVSLDSKFIFVIGGTLPTQPPSELETENLALIDIEEKTCYKISLKKPVSRAACSIFNKRLLFIAGG